MFRDRTNLYLSYRRTLPRSAPRSDTRFDTLIEEEEGLMGARRSTSRYRDINNEIEMKPMVPSIYEIAQELEQHINSIKGQTNELNSTYKQLIIASKNDRSKTENKIENMNYQILKIFEKCYVLIKKFEYLEVNHERLQLYYTENDLAILNNYRKNYAIKIQDTSLAFRNLQNNYIKFLRDDEDGDDALLNTHISDSSNLLVQEEESSKIEDYSKQIIQQQQIKMQNNNSQLLQQREKEISKIAMGILEISTIFKEMESMVVDQGSILDRVDYNLQNTVQDLKTSDKELLKARSYQKRTTKCKIIFLLSLIVFALFIIVLVKPHSSTKVVEAPSKGSDSRPNIEHPPDKDGSEKSTPTSDDVSDDRGVLPEDLNQLL